MKTHVETALLHETKRDLTPAPRGVAPHHHEEIGVETEAETEVEIMNDEEVTTTAAEATTEVGMKEIGIEIETGIMTEKEGEIGVIEAEMTIEIPIEGVKMSPETTRGT